MSIENLLAFSKTAQKKQESSNVTEAVTEALDEFLWGLNSDAEYEEDGYGGVLEHGFHPSSICYAQCARKLVYEYLGAEGESEEVAINPVTRRILDNGHGCHDRIQMYFTLMSRKNNGVQLLGDWKCKACGKPVSPDKEIPAPVKFKCSCGCTRYKYNEFRLRDKKLRLVGKRDMKLLIGTKKYLGEIKSMRSFQFKNLMRPTAPHIKQFSFYMLMDGTREGIFLYENKDSQEIKLFYHKFNVDDISDELSLLSTANKAVNEKKFPTYLSGHPNCATCKTCHLRKVCADKKLSFSKLAAEGKH